MKLLDLFIASLIPVAKILLVTGLGLYLALDRVGILGQDARKNLNNVVFYVLSPSLVGSSLAETITYESMVKMWFMPVNVLLTFILGTFLGLIVIKVTKPASHLRGLILGCCAAGNLGNLPLIIIPAVCKGQGTPFGDAEACKKYGLGYVSLSMALGAIYVWTYVYNLIRVTTTASKGTDGEGCTETELLMTPEEEETAYALPTTKINSRPEVATWDKIKQGLNSLVKNISLQTLFAPPTIAAIIASVIGLVPDLRKLLIGDDAPLYVIKDSVALVGDGAIPAITLIVGGNLLGGLRGSGIRKSIVVGIIVARYVFLPIIGVMVVRGAFWLGLVSSEPLYQFVLLLQFVLPPAMNIGTITQLFGAGETETSVILLWTYAFAVVSLTIWPTFFMWLVA